MNIEILKEKLSKALGIIEQITKKKTSLPILNNVLLETEKNFLKITATNLETSVVWWILVNCKKEGKIAVPASFLNNLLGYIKNKKLQLSSNNENLVLESENQNNQIQGVKTDDFPIIPKVESEELVELEGDKLYEGINGVYSIPSPSEVKPEISGVYFWFKKNELKVVGTDSFRLAEKTIKLDKEISGEFSFILPQSAARNLLGILAANPGKVKIYYDNNQVLFEWLNKETDSSSVKFLSRLIEGQYPNYEEIIPKESAIQTTLDREEFQNQIKKAGLFSGKVSEVNITCLPQDQQVKIFSQSPETGKNESSISTKVRSGEESISNSFNYRFLVDGLNNIKSSEVEFNLSNKEGPASITPVGDKSYLYVLMPIKS